MGRTAWAIICIVGAAVMAGIAIVSAAMGGCETMVELANGGSAPMKCHWTFVADTFIPLAGIAISLLAATCKEQSGRRAAAVGYIAVAVIAACMPASFAVGLCAMPDMHCHGTAHIVWALCAVAVVMGAVLVAKSNPDTSDLPKYTL